MASLRGANCAYLSLALGMVACGGESTEAAASRESGPVDAALWVEGTDSIEVRGVYRKTNTMVRFGSAYGASGWSPDRERILLEEDVGELTVVTTERERHSVNAVNGYSFAWSPDGQRSAVVEPDRLAIGDANGEELAGVAADGVGTNPALDWSPDGSKVAYQLESGVVIVDADTLATHGVRAPGYLGLYWAPSSTWFATLTSDAIEIFATDGTPAGTFAGAGALAYGWSPDGKYFAAGSCGGDIVVASPEGASPESLGTTSCKAEWSPVEPRLAFAGEGALSIWSSTDGVSSAFAGLYDAWSWSWSPDGSMLALKDDNGDESVLIDSHDGTERARVPGEVRWNAAGDWLLSFLREADEVHYELFTAPGDGSAAASIASGVQSFTFLPDGEHLAYATDREFFTVRVDGSERKKVWTTPTDKSRGWFEPQAPCRECTP